MLAIISVSVGSPFISRLSPVSPNPRHQFVGFRSVTFDSLNPDSKSVGLTTFNSLDADPSDPQYLNFLINWILNIRLPGS